MHHTTANYYDFWSQKYISGGLTSLDEVTEDEMVSETNLFQTACSSVQNKANKRMTEEMWKESMFELEDIYWYKVNWGKRAWRVWVWNCISSEDCQFNLV